MVDRRAPRRGYDVGVKRQYRRDVWAAFRRNAPVPMTNAVALILPSIEGDEIEVARGAGLREEHIHVCDENPAIVAVLKRRYPRIVTHGIPVRRVLTERPHMYHLINLDLCGVLDGVLSTVGPSVMALRDGGCLALTWQKGRDQRWCAANAALGIRREEYATAVVRSIGEFSLRTTSTLRQAQYRSGRVPMQWAAWKLSLDTTADPQSEETQVRAVAGWMKYHSLLGRSRHFGREYYIPHIPVLPREESARLMTLVRERLSLKEVSV